MVVSEEIEDISNGTSASVQILIKMYFICNDKRISDNNTYNEGGIGLCKMDSVKDHLIERGNCCESDKSSRFYILCIIDISLIICTLNPIGKLGKNDNNEEDKK